jgi:hypothetical protein
LYIVCAISTIRFVLRIGQEIGQRANRGLRPAALDAIVDAGHMLEGFAQRWAAAQTSLAKNKLLRLILVGAQIKGHSLAALVAKLPFYPLMRQCH